MDDFGKRFAEGKDTMFDNGTGLRNLMDRQAVEVLDILKQTEAALVNLAYARDDDWMSEYEAWLDEQEEEQRDDR